MGEDSYSFFKVAGILLIITVTLNMVLKSSLLVGLSSFLWYCDFAALILAYGLLAKNKLLVGGVAVTSLPAQFMWVVDFFLELSGYGMGRTAQIMTKSFFRIAVTTSMHLLVIPISFYFIYKYGYSKKSYRYGFWIFIIFLLGASYIVTSFITSPRQNLNCVLYPCDMVTKDISQLKSHPFFLTPYYLGYSYIKWTVLMSINHGFLKKYF